MDELKKRGVVRTRNNPVSDYAEWLVHKKMGFRLTGNSTQGVDATDDKGIRYQVKARHLISRSSSKQLGVIRNFKKKQFDFLIVVMFDRDFNIESAFQIPHGLISKYARFSRHQNGHILIMRGGVLSDSRTRDITSKLR
jgi:hypothetical protein